MAIFAWELKGNSITEGEQWVSNRKRVVGSGLVHLGNANERAKKRQHINENQATHGVFQMHKTIELADYRHALNTPYILQCQFGSVRTSRFRGVCSG